MTTTTDRAEVEPGTRRQAAQEVHAATVAVAREHGRPDLATALARDGARLLDPGARVLVVGDHHQGKSSLVDALLDARVCPVHHDVATRVPTLVGWSSEPTAVLVGPDGREEVGPARLAEAVTGRDEPPPGGWVQAEIGLPHPLLAEGLTLVDAPGAGPRGLATLTELPAVDAVVLVSDASRELAAGELDLLRAAADHVGTVVVALTKCDLHVAWREVAGLDRALLAEHGLGVPVLPVSAALREEARRRDDAALDRESGVPALVDVLRERVVVPVGGRRGRALLDEVDTALGQLRGVLTAEQAALEGRAGDLDAELAAATARAAALKAGSARWQQTLADGVADLVADVEWDLRDRVRHVVRLAEEALEETDPAATWDQFAPWLTEQIGQAVATTYLWAGERTWWLAERVGAHFAEAPPDAGEVPAVPGRTGAELPAMPALDEPSLERIGLAQGVLVGLRGSYGGMVMVGLVSTMAGLALINPFSVGAALVLGGRTVRDERRRALRRRRLDARGVVRRHADEVLFALGKHTKDTLREVQRMLRDHFTTRAEVATAAATAAVRAATAARDVDAATRERRRREVREGLARLDALADRARAALEPAPALAGASA